MDSTSELGRQHAKCGGATVDSPELVNLHQFAHYNITNMNQFRLTRSDVYQRSP